MSRDFFNARATIWDERVAEKDTGKLESLAGRLDIAPGAAVLDVGTGTGVFLPSILRKIGAEGSLVCLDYAEAMLEEAKNKGYKGKIRYVCAAIEESGLPDEGFDAVICYSVFPHFTDKPRALSEIRRLLKKGGGLFIGHTSSRQHINEIHAGLPEVHDHLLPDAAEMRALLLDAGFVEISVADEEESYLACARKPL